MTIAQIARVAYLVGHHHTLRGIDGIDYQILIEASAAVGAYDFGEEDFNVFAAAAVFRCVGDVVRL